MRKTKHPLIEFDPRFPKTSDHPWQLGQGIRDTGESTGWLPVHEAVAFVRGIDDKDKPKAIGIVRLGYFERP